MLETHYYGVTRGTGQKLPHYRGDLSWLPSKAKITLANLAKVKKFPLAKSEDQTAAQHNVISGSFQ